jgi:hypothetical protein
LKPRGQLEAQNRPCLTINRLPQFVNQAPNTVRMNLPSSSRFRLAV